MTTLPCQRTVLLEKQRPQREQRVNEKGKSIHVILYKMFINIIRFEA